MALGIGFGGPAKMTGDQVLGDTTTEALTVNGKFNVGAPASVTIATGAFTMGDAVRHIVTGEGGAADDLDTINGAGSTLFITLQPVDSSNDITVKDGTGNLRLEGDFVMDHTDDRIFLMAAGAIWYEISRSNNAT
jgi:hypothetical protein